MCAEIEMCGTYKMNWQHQTGIGGQSRKINRARCGVRGKNMAKAPAAIQVHTTRAINLSVLQWPSPTLPRQEPRVGLQGVCATIAPDSVVAGNHVATLITEMFSLRCLPCIQITKDSGPLGLLRHADRPYHRRACACATFRINHPTRPRQHRAHCHQTPT